MTISLALTDRQDSATIQAGRRKLDLLHIVISVQANVYTSMNFHSFTNCIAKKKAKQLDLLVSIEPKATTIEKP